MNDIGTSSEFDWLHEEPEVQDMSGHYERRDIIGRGGYADIWAAKDLRNNRAVAVKSLRMDKNAEPESRNAFLREARLMIYLRHPGIVPVYDFFKDVRGCLHIVMKLVMGRTLEELLCNVHDEYASLMPKELAALERKRLYERLEIFLKVCDMIAYAHEKRILHRDLKPSNIMLGSQRDVYVMDWGIAEPHPGPEPLQTPEETSGTVRYLAPEIIRRKTYDERSDVYSLGVMLFELTYLHAAYMQKSDKDACYCIVTGKSSPHKHDYGYRVPAWLVRVIDAAMAIEPDKRTPSVVAMMEQIREGMASDASLFGRLKRLIGL